MRYLPYLAALALAVYCIVDISQHVDPRPHRLPKWAWYLIVLVPFLGAAAWLLLKYVDPFEDTHDPRHDGPVAPDDDLDYLRWLEQQERRRKREGGRS